MKNMRHKNSEPLPPAEDANTPTENAFVTDINTGLTAAEAQSRVTEGKINGDQDVKTKSISQIFRSNIFTFFNMVFLALAVIMCFFCDWKSNFLGSVGNFGFMVLVLFNTSLGIIQEIRAKRTIDKLSLISAPKAKVLRDGEIKEIPVSEILLDDMTVLETGSQICADSFVADGTLEVNESLITGEPDAILKRPGDKLLSGSFVVSGKAKAQVEHIGLDNFATKISAGAKYFKKPNSEIWRSLMLIVKVMAAVIVPVGIALFLVKYNVQRSGDLNETVRNTVATVIGMIPSGLVALSSTVFCVSVLRLSRHKTLAQDMYCVETLARVDVLCLDKTGTITEGAMDVNGIHPLADRGEEEIKQILKNFTSSLQDDNATSNALKAYTAELESTAVASVTIPFSSDRKWSGARIGGTSYVLGAPEFVFANPTKKLSDAAGELAAKGYRVLVLAASANAFGANALPKALKAVCLVTITDRIRKEAPDTLRFFKDEGVQVKIISGDNPSTVRAVAMRAGLENCDDMIDMSTLKTDEEVAAAATKYTIFGRVLPNQKRTLVSALRAAGHTVAMTGDGVNDVLALKTADCSVAMASGSDAAKNVSSLVLMDSNFASMPKVVAEGRRSINNLERAAGLYLMKTIYNTLLAILFMIVNQRLPFEPSNLTLMGAVTIGIPSVILALEPNKQRVSGCFLPKVLSNALPGGLTVLLGTIAVLICNKYFLTDLTASQASQIFIIIITFVGFMMLIRVSLPLSPLHVALDVLMIAIFVLCYAVPTPNDIVINYFSLDSNITWAMGKAILVIGVILIPIFVGMALGLHEVDKHFGEFWNRKFSRLDMFLRKVQQH